MVAPGKEPGNVTLCPLLMHRGFYSRLAATGALAASPSVLEAVEAYSAASAGALGAVFSHAGSASIRCSQANTFGNSSSGT